MYIVASGSAGSKELAPGERNTYTVFEIGEEHIRVLCRMISPTGEKLGSAFEINLPIKPR
jgi:hypothetical protein